jgi:hypothetical protein
VTDAGGSAELVVGDDMPHIYPLFAEFLPEAATAVERTGEFVRRTVTARRLAAPFARRSRASAPHHHPMEDQHDPRF